jgi:hypothetical protein
VARPPDLQLRALWREHIDRQLRSRLTVAQFCARERLPVASFYGWKRRLQLIGLAGQQRALPSPSTFLPVRVRVAEHVRDEPLPIEADLPNGVRLRIPTSNTRLACRLVRAVAAARTDNGGSR